MKKSIIVLFCALTVLLAGCAERTDMNSALNKPTFAGLVNEVTDNTITVSVNADEDVYKSGAVMVVSLDVEIKDGLSEYSVGDEVRVFYDGNIAESDPPQINKVYAILIVNESSPSEDQLVPPDEDIPSESETPPADTSPTASEPTSPAVSEPTSPSSQSTAPTPPVSSTPPAIDADASTVKIEVSMEAVKISDLPFPVSFTIQNNSSKEITVEPYYEVQKYDGANWIAFPFNPDEPPNWPEGNTQLEPNGSMDDSMSIWDFASEITPGTYRIAKVVSEDGKMPFTIYAEFPIVD